VRRDESRAEAGKGLVIRFRVISIIQNWIKLRYKFLRVDVEWRRLLKKFIAYLRNSDDVKAPTWASLLQRTFKRVRQGYHDAKKKISTLTPGKKPARSSLRHSRSTLLSIPIENLVAQITYRDQINWMKIDIEEFMFKRWMKEQKDEASNLLKFIEQFNQNSFWIATEIISANTAKETSNVITYFICSLHYFKETRNFNGMFSVLSALNMASVAQRKSAWKEVKILFVIFLHLT